MRLLIRWLLLTASLIVVVKVVPGLETVPPWYDLFLASLALAALNLLAHPLLWLARVVTFPLSCLTLGLWTVLLGLVCNGLIFYFVGTLRWGWGFQPTATSGQRFVAALVGALAVSVLNAILSGLYSLSRRRQPGNQP